MQHYLWLALYTVHYNYANVLTGGKLLMQWENGFKVYNCLQGVYSVFGIVSFGAQGEPHR